MDGFTTPGNQINDAVVFKDKFGTISLQDHVHTATILLFSFDQGTPQPPQKSTSDKSISTVKADTTKAKNSKKGEA